MSKALKISDLAVGDWVKVADGLIAQVEYPRLRHDLVGVRFAEPFRVQAILVEKQNVELEYIHPIPITPEILKKNGFRCIAVGDNGPSTPRQNYMRYEKWRVETQWGYRDLFFDRMTKRYRFVGMNEYTFTEVHKLQHALRFSNFEKEIIL